MYYGVEMFGLLIRIAKLMDDLPKHVIESEGCEFFTMTEFALIYDYDCIIAKYF